MYRYYFEQTRFSNVRSRKYAYLCTNARSKSKKLSEKKKKILKLSTDALKIYFITDSKYLSLLLPNVLLTTDTCCWHRDAFQNSWLISVLCVQVECDKRAHEGVSPPSNWHTPLHNQLHNPPAHGKALSLLVRKSSWEKQWHSPLNPRRFRVVLRRLSKKPATY